jgi:hypothetical protein
VGGVRRLQYQNMTVPQHRTEDKITSGLSFSQVFYVLYY